MERKRGMQEGRGRREELREGERDRGR